VRSGPGKTARNQKKKGKKSTVVSSKKKSTVMSPIRRRMKKRNPSGGQNGQLVHWWLLIHSGRALPTDKLAEFRQAENRNLNGCNCLTVNRQIVGPDCEQLNNGW
jgi:hypothetical protein